MFTYTQKSKVQYELWYIPFSLQFNRIMCRKYALSEMNYTVTVNQTCNN